VVFLFLVGGHRRPEVRRDSLATALQAFDCVRIGPHGAKSSGTGVSAQTYLVPSGPFAIRRSDPRPGRQEAFSPGFLVSEHRQVFAKWARLGVAPMTHAHPRCGAARPVNSAVLEGEAMFCASRHSTALPTRT
jgi:hypothetical protein